VELNNRMVMLNKLTSVAVTFIGMFVCVCMVPDGGVGSTNAIAGSTLSRTMVIVSVWFSLLLVSLTVALMKKVPSGSPVKLMNNGLVADVFNCTNPVVLNKNSEMVSIAILSVAVTFAGMNVCDKNELLAGVGSTSCIAGGVTSFTTNVVVSVSFTLLLVSFAIIKAV